MEYGVENLQMMDGEHTVNSTTHCLAGSAYERGKLIRLISVTLDRLLEFVVFEGEARVEALSMSKWR